MAGEEIVIQRLQRIRDVNDAIVMTKVKEPAKHFENVRNELFDDVLPEREMSVDEKQKRIEQHHKRLFSMGPTHTKAQTGRLRQEKKNNKK